MRYLVLPALAGLLFVVAFAALLGWWGSYGSSGGLYAMSFAVLSLLAGLAVMRLRR